jgi:hypothetical protein
MMMTDDILAASIEQRLCALRMLAIFTAAAWRTLEQQGNVDVMTLLDRSPCRSSPPAATSSPQDLPAPPPYLLRRGAGPF